MVERVGLAVEYHITPVDDLGRAAQPLPARAHQLVGEHRAALRVQLLAPVHSAAAPGVPLIQCFQVDELGLAIGPLETGKMIIRSGASESNRHECKPAERHPAHNGKSN